MITGRRRLLTDAQLVRAKELVALGRSKSSVAKLLGVARSTLQFRLKEQYKQPERLGKL